MQSSWKGEYYIYVREIRLCMSMLMVVGAFVDFVAVVDVGW